MTLKQVIIRKNKPIPELDLRLPENSLLKGFCYYMCMRTAEVQNYTSILTTTEKFCDEFDFLGKSKDGYPCYNHIVVDQSRTYSKDELSPLAKGIIEDPDSLSVIGEIRANNPEKSESSDNMVEVLISRMMNIIGLEDERPAIIAVNFIKMCILDDMRTVITQNRIVTTEPNWKKFDEDYDRALKEEYPNMLESGDA